MKNSVGCVADLRLTRRAGSRTKKAGPFRGVVAIAVAAFCLSACGGEASEPGSTAVESESLHARVARALNIHAIEYTAFVIDEDAGTVIVDGDIEMRLDRLLDPVSTGSLLQPDGYYANANTNNNADGRGAQAFAAPRAASVRLSFGSTVSAAWQTAFIQAASQWSVAACIEISTVAAATDTLTVSVANLNASNVYAIATFPFGTGGNRVDPTVIVHPGPVISINSSFGCAPSTCTSIEGLSAQLKRQVALHEIGHTLGFTHQGTESQIHGTASGNAYSTVMVAAFGEPGLGSLSNDDIASRDLVFRQFRVCDGRGFCQNACP